jgi:hypothetical protein
MYMITFLLCMSCHGPEDISVNRMESGTSGGGGGKGIEF